MQELLGMSKDEHIDFVSIRDVVKAREVGGMKLKLQYFYIEFYREP